jgi:VanZ family protein
VKPFLWQKLWMSMAYAMLVLVAILSLIPAPQDMPGNDKVLHLVTYAGLSLVFTVLLIGRHNVWAIVVLLIAFGAAIEGLQGLTGYRMAEAEDLAANSLGVLIGASTYWTPLPLKLRSLERKLLSAVRIHD